MSPGRSIAAFLLSVPFALLVGCGEEKEPEREQSSNVSAVDPTPTRPDSTPPSSGQPSTGPGRPPVPRSDIPADPPPPKIALLLGPNSDPALAADIIQAATAQKIPLQQFSTDEIASSSGSPVILAVLPLVPDPKSDVQNSKWILVGTPGSASPLPPHLSHIHPDYRAYGNAAGNEIIAELARQSERGGRAAIVGNVVQIRASDEDPASELLHEGFLEVLDRHSGVIFVHDGPGFWRKDDAQKRMEEALRIQKNIRAVFAHSNEMARGATTAITAFHRSHRDAPDIVVFGIGGPEGADDPLFSGAHTSSASISYRPLAEKAVEIATRLAADPAVSIPPGIPVAPE